MNRSYQRTHLFLSACLFLAILSCLALQPAGAGGIALVPVHNAGNAADSTGFGAVDYNYYIGKYEVTNAQYTEFLNAADSTGTNTLGLYDGSMSSDARGGIDFNGGAADGSKYSVKTGRANNPVVFVDWYDTLRFSNWHHNGGGAGSTETGAYTLEGGTPVPSNGETVTRNPGALYFLPSEDEWHKAAYHKNNGVTGDYWEYPTRSDMEPYSDQPPGFDAPIQFHTANYRNDDGMANGYNDGFAVTGSNVFDNNQNYLTDVGAYTASVGPYDTFDQGGNVFEWTERDFLGDGSLRGLRGGSWGSDSDFLAGSSPTFDIPTVEDDLVGFRIASVPEPTSLTLCVLGLIGVLVWQWRRKGR